jgi:hypothetical protein
VAYYFDSSALVKRYIAETGSDYDSVQLAAALYLQRFRFASGLTPLTFVSADARLNAVAQANSLLVENPNGR